MKVTKTQLYDELSVLEQKHISLNSELPCQIRKNKPKRTSIRSKARRLVQQYRTDNPDSLELWGAGYPRWCTLHAEGKPGVTPLQPTTYDEEIGSLYNIFQNGLAARKEAKRVSRLTHVAPPRWAKTIPPQEVTPLNESTTASFLRNHCQLVLTTRISELSDREKELFNSLHVSNFSYQPRSRD